MTFDKHLGWHPVVVLHVWYHFVSNLRLSVQFLVCQLLSHQNEADCRTHLSVVYRYVTALDFPLVSVIKTESPKLSWMDDTILLESVLWGYIRTLIRLNGLFHQGVPWASSHRHTPIHSSVQTHSPPSIPLASGVKLPWLTSSQWAIRLPNMWRVNLHITVDL